MANQVPSEVVETLYQIAGGDYAGVIGRLRTNERIAKFVTMFADDASYTNLRVIGKKVCPEPNRNPCDKGRLHAGHSIAQQCPSTPPLHLFR